MLKPTNNPIRAFRRAAEHAARSTREALAAGGTQPFQAVAKLQRQIEALLDLVLRLPATDAAQDVRQGFGIDGATPGGWVTVAEIVLASPGEKNRVVVSASAQGTVLDTVTAGLTTSNCRILINGNPSPVIPAAKDQGASVVQNVLTVSHVLEVTPLPPTVRVQFQMSPLNPAAFGPQPSNIANLTVYVGYSVV